MLHRTALFEDAVPDVGRILRLFGEQLFEIGIFDDEAARQRLVRIDVRRDRLDARAGAAAAEHALCAGVVAL